MKCCYFDLGNNPVLFLKYNFESKIILYTYEFSKWYFIGGIISLD